MSGHTYSESLGVVDVVHLTVARQNVPLAVY